MPPREKESLENDDRILDINIKVVEGIFRKYYQPLVYYAYRFVGDVQIAENMVHDLFIQIWQNRYKIDFDLNIKTYLFNGVRNNCLNYLDRKSTEYKYKTQQIELQYDENTPETELVQKEIQISIQKAVNALAPRCKEIFCMSRFDGFTYREIADILNISVKTVDNQMTRALKSLRKHLAKWITTSLFV